MRPAMRRRVIVQGVIFGVVAWAAIALLTIEVASVL